MIQIESSNVSYSDEYIEADYEYFDTKCVKEDGKIKVIILYSIFLINNLINR